MSTALDKYKCNIMYKKNPYGVGFASTQIHLYLIQYMSQQNTHLIK